MTTAVRIRADDGFDLAATDFVPTPAMSLRGWPIAVEWLAGGR